MVGVANVFQDRRFQPLTHSSVSDSSLFCELANELLQHHYQDLAELISIYCSAFHRPHVVVCRGRDSIPLLANVRKTLSKHHAANPHSTWVFENPEHGR